MNYSKFDGPCETIIYKIYHILVKLEDQLKLGQKNNRDCENSAIREHYDATHHRIDFAQPNVLIMEKDLKKRKILERLYMQKFDCVENNRGMDLMLF